MHRIGDIVRHFNIYTGIPGNNRHRISFEFYRTKVRISWLIMNKKISITILSAIVFFTAVVVSLRFIPGGQKHDEQYKEQFSIHNRAYAVPLPEEISFAGEPAPMDLYYVREGLDRELLVNTYWHSNTILLLKRAARYFPVIEPVLKANGVPDDFKYVALIESGLMNVVSPSNAAGFWQFLDKTGRQYGLEVTEQVDERYNHKKSTEAACRYLKDAYKQLNNWTLAAASYNAGQGRITREVSRQSADNYYDLYLNQETSRYIFRILALKLIYEDPTAYGFYLREKDLYPPFKTISVIVDTNITDLINFAARQKVNYRILKEFNPWLRTDQLKVAPGKNYVIDLPEDGYTGYTKLQKGLQNGEEIFGRKADNRPDKSSSGEAGE